MRGKRLLVGAAIFITILLYIGTYMYMFHKGTVQYEYQWLTQYIFIESMQFRGEDKDWKVIYQVKREGPLATSLVYIIPKNTAFDMRPIKYSLSIGPKRESGELNSKKSEGSYYFKSDILPKKDSNIKLTIQCGKKISEVSLKNLITDEVIPPEKALDIYMENFSNEQIDKFTLSITFDEIGSTKVWVLPVSGGVVRIDAVSGQIIQVIRDRDLY